MRSIRRFSFGFLAVFAASLCVAPPAEAAEWGISSPADTLTFTVRHTGNGALEYRVQLARLNGGPKTVIDWSALGVIRSWVDQTADSSTVTSPSR
jgi:hypothetical protein